MNPSNAGTNKNEIHIGNILFLLLPFWTPLIPPLGISCLKSYLSKYGYNSITVDANTNIKFEETFHNYCEILKRHIPENKRGNFYNFTHKVLRNHAMSYINKKDENEHFELVRLLVEKYFFCHVDLNQIKELDGLMKVFYINLEKYLVDLIDKHKPSIVGISVYTGTLPASVFAFKLIKERYPDIKTVMGGGVFSDQLCMNSANFERFLAKVPYIDGIFVGEGEEIFLKYLQGELSEDKKVYSINDNKKNVLDLSTVDIPDFSDFNLQYYSQSAAYASRSCPHQCSFCSETVQWGQFRKKDIVQVVDELIRQYEKHGTQLYLFCDSLLNPFISELAEELIKRDVSFYWDGYLRADKHVCDTENTMRWRRGGFYRARLGVESGSQHVLELMNKKITPEQIKAAVSSLAYAGIKTTTYWVVGHPGETEEDFMQTLSLIGLLKDDIYEAECNVFEYYANAQVSSDKWSNDYGTALLFPENYTELLITQIWEIKTQPDREEVFRRACRFVEHCNKLGIPNPYSMLDIYKADERWRRLHKNAVPLLTDFKNKKIFISENKKIII